LKKTVKGGVAKIKNIIISLEEKQHQAINQEENDNGDIARKTAEELTKLFFTDRPHKGCKITEKHRADELTKPTLKSNGNKRARFQSFLRSYLNGNKPFQNWCQFASIGFVETEI
jgi:hypothetical protein